MASSSQGLNVIALISGGKDSLYSLLHCIRNGHNVVALANLHPAPHQSTHGHDSGSRGQDSSDDIDEDIDSFMYQTIGHSVIPLYEEALRIPLYRAAITGGALDTARVYRNETGDPASASTTAPSDESSSGTPEDETESLVPLLRRVMQAHPEANAVSAGAILSTYQRTRIENIAARLGLVPLAWLWMYPSLPAPTLRAADPAAVGDAGLLEDMAGCGCDARIIKVASGGLDDGFLWENVSGMGGPGRALRRRIVKGMSRFAGAEDLRGAVLGEGGEYETLAVDGPALLWKARIEIEITEQKAGEAGVAYMKLRGAKCVPKHDDESTASFSPEDVRRPGLLDEAFAAALTDVGSSKTALTVPSSRSEAVSSPAWSDCEPYHHQSESTWTIANLVAPEAGSGAAEQMSAIVDKTKEILQSHPHSRSTEDIVFATVLLGSMADFSPMNKVYVSLFKKPNPPARVSVACGDRLPSNAKVMISFTVDLGPRNDRQGLHVQSRSYWAPANIGPYSQAISIPLQKASRLVYIAGQIPLEPASMEVATEGKTWFDDYCLRAVLSMQHLWRIGEAMQVDWWLGAVAFLTGNEIATQAQVAWHLWKKIHAQPDESDEDDPELDVWDLKYGRRSDDLMPRTVSSTLPRFSVLTSEDKATTSPFLAVEVAELPRNSDIEWQGLGGRCEHVTLSSSDDCVSTVADHKYSYMCREIEETQSPLVDNLRAVIASHCQGQGLSQVVLYTTQPMAEGFWPGQVVPCRSVWGRAGRPLRAGVIIQCEKSTST
ncbi:hypothetical protein N7492_004330 [Penicillium capsulatum]|uniref:Diphthine--ammonia ligase n=1 Tax=Penicillium capsulatum TaxID=69766 RepID=A0A9W9IDK4_9EURO|nr:hypothetical protein N7492_004330 [Penicillium capsulatum]KAJ6136552.1 hypothetical protein N7512_001712 [Penicillium capsulatum]